MKKSIYIMHKVDESYSCSYIHIFDSLHLTAIVAFGQKIMTLSSESIVVVMAALPDAMNVKIQPTKLHWP